MGPGPDPLAGTAPAGSTCRSAWATRSRALVGAGPGEVVATDSTSVNLFKVLQRGASHRRRRTRRSASVVVSERSNFPTDLYIAEALCRERGFELRLVDAASELPAALDDDVAVLMLTQVNYRTGAHARHGGADARRACGRRTRGLGPRAQRRRACRWTCTAPTPTSPIGCGYKYLNGGPGAPAFVWVHPRHAERFGSRCRAGGATRRRSSSRPSYRPAAGIARYLCGTQPILRMAALECGLDTVLAAEPLGGMAALRAQVAGADRAVHRAGRGALRRPRPGLVTPREHARRGSQVCLTRERRRLRDRAGADRARRDRRLPRRRRADPTSCASASRRCTLRFVDDGTRSSTCGRCSRAASGSAPEFNQQAAVT